MSSLGTIARLNHLALCRHNLSEAAQIRVRAGTARLDVDFTDEAGLTSPYLTFSGGTNGTRTNEYGVMVSGTCPRYEHDRRLFENGVLSSEDLGPTGGWSSDSVYRYPDGQTVDFTKASSSVNQALTALRSLPAGTYEMKAQVRLVSGDGSFAFQLFDGQNFLLGSTNVATSDWKWFSSSLVTPGPSLSANSYAYILKQVAAGVLQIRRIQVRSGASNGKYTKTTNQRRYQRIGVITEAGATNSLLWSSDLTNAVWSNFGGCTIVSNNVVAPDGTTTMDTISASANSQGVLQIITGGGTTRRAASVIFHKPSSTSTSARLVINWNTGGTLQQIDAYFNPSTGAFVNTVLTSTPTLLKAGVKDLGNGYFRAYVVGQGTDAANTKCNTYLLHEALGAGTIAAWGFQNEASFVTSYIPTTSAAVSRTTDATTLEATTWFPYAFNPSEGTIYHEASIDEIGGGSTSTLAGSYILVRDGPATNAIYSGLTSLNGTQQSLAVTVVAAGATTWQSVQTDVADGQVTRSAFRYRAGDWAAACNGAIAATGFGSSSTGVPSGLTSLEMMNQAAVTSYLRRVTIWPAGRSNAELQALTTSGPSAVDYDSGWSDVLQMTPYTQLPALWGYDYDIIKSFTDHSVEWIRVGIYDPAKTSSSTPFEIGRLFTGKVKLQPATNAEFGVADNWNDATSFLETQSRRKIFNVLPKLREVAFTFPVLSLAEGAALHEMDGANGISTEVLYLPDPSDEAACQRYGFVGLMQTLNPLQYPQFNARSKAYQIRDKR
jgi:hypothetical protein